MEMSGAGRIEESFFRPKALVQKEEEVKEKERTEIDNTYRFVETGSFARAAEDIVVSDSGNTLCMIDFDNTCTGKGQAQIRNPSVGDSVKKAFPFLVESLPKGAVCVTTNRTDGSKFLDRAVFRTDKANETLDSFLEETELSSSVKVFRSLNKQIPNYSNGDREELVEHFVKCVRENEVRGRLRLCVIEDNSLLALDRRIFPKEIAKKVRERVNEELGRDIGIDVVDYVLKR